MVLLGTGDPDAERFFAWADAPPRRPLSRLAAVRQRPRPPHRGGRRLLPDAVALRAVRPQPDVQPALRHAAGRARHRRPRRHRRQLRRERPAAAPASCSTTCTPESLANTIGWAVSTWYDRPDHIGRCAPRHGARLLVGARRLAYRDLYLGPTSAGAATPSRPDRAARLTVRRRTGRSEQSVVSPPGVARASQRAVRGGPRPGKGAPTRWHGP